MLQIHSLFNQNSKIPSDGRIAEELDITIEEYYQITDNLGPLFLHSLDSEYINSSDDKDMHFSEIANSQNDDYDTEKYKANIKKAIIDSIHQLPEKEKLVISYYYEQMNLKEIGIVLGVTGSRISQIHSSAIVKLSTWFKNIFKIKFEDKMKKLIVFSFY